MLCPDKQRVEAMPSRCPSPALQTAVREGRAAMPSFLSNLGWTECQLCRSPGWIPRNLPRLGTAFLSPFPWLQGFGDLFLC